LPLGQTPECLSRSCAARGKNPEKQFLTSAIWALEVGGVILEQYASILPQKKTPAHVVGSSSKPRQKFIHQFLSDSKIG
jgi:hypothetical protein